MKRKVIKGVDVLWRLVEKARLRTEVSRKYGFEVVDLEMFLSFHELGRHDVGIMS